MCLTFNIGRIADMEAVTCMRLCKRVWTKEIYDFCSLLTDSPRISPPPRYSPPPRLSPPLLGYHLIGSMHPMTGLFSMATLLPLK